MKSQTPKFREFISNCVSKARSIVFGTSEYEVKFKWASEPRYDDTDNLVSYFDISVNAPYLSATITVYPEAKKLYNRGCLYELAQGCLHEICHIILAPISEAAKDDARPSQLQHCTNLVETATERICRSLARQSPDWWK